MSTEPSPQSGPRCPILISDENSPPDAVMPPEEIPMVMIHDDRENQRADTGRSVNPNVPLGVPQEVPQESAPAEPLPPYPGPSTYPNMAYLELDEDTRKYMRLAIQLREALAGASPKFTPAEIDLAQFCMGSTTRNNLQALHIESREAGDQFFKQYAKAVDLLQVAVIGASDYWETVLLNDEVRSAASPSTVIEFFLVTKILLPRLQELVDLMGFLDSITVS